MNYASVPGVIETRESFGETTLVVDPARLVKACTALRDAHGFNFLSDIAAADYLGWGEQEVAGYIGTADGRDLHVPGAQGLARVPDPKPKRFSISYHLLRVSDDPVRVRVQVLARRRRADRQRHTGVARRRLVRARGVGHAGDPLRGAREPRAYPHAGGLGGPPAPQGLPARRRARSLLGRGLMSVLPSTRVYEGTRIPHPVPTILEVDPAKHRLDDILRVNFGPNHPSTHGVLRLVVDLDGETVAGIRAVIGYLHTGFEKNMEHKSWWKSVTYAPRIDYVSFHANELLYVLAIEKLLGIEVPRRAVWARMAMAELNRIHSHLVWLGTSALELARSRCSGTASTTATRSSTSSRWPAGRACTPATSRSAASPRTCRPPSRRGAEVLRVNAEVGRRVRGDPRPQRDLARADEGRRATLRRRRHRTRAVGADAARDRGRLGSPARRCRTSPTTRSTSTCPVYGDGDVYDRYLVHMDEMRESVRIVRQCLDRLDETDGEPWIADDRKVVLPPRHELHTSMESLIHHFKIVTEGFTVPEGEVYVAIESPRGETGCYLVSDGGARPWRVKFRAPSFAALQATATIVQGLLIADLIAAGGSLDPVMGDADR